VETLSAISLTALTLRVGIQLGDMIGQTIAHYEILKILGEGGMGIVYQARDINLDRPVAIKFLHPHRYLNEKEKERFIVEAKAAAWLDHPNICTIYEINTTATGELFIAMAFYQGETLHRKLSNGRLAIDDALKYSIDVAQGLAKAHNQGIVHRDIKPENIFVTADGIVKILDFGLAKLLYDPSQSEGFLGTPEYMAPEQIEGRSDRRTDLWALGVVLYEMIIGQRPFVAPSRSEVLRAISKYDFVPPSDLRLEVPHEVEKLIARALSKSPADRYQRAEEMLAHLHALRHGIQSPGTATTPVAQAWRPNSIAVLPFANISREDDTEYFADGLAEELIHMLSQVRGLLVVSHTSSFEFKGKNQSVRSIGEQLQVNTVLEGSVRRVGEKLRITAQLTNALEGYSIWSQRYDRELKDVFAVQEDIALSIVSTLKTKLQPEVSLRPRYAGNVEAYGLYLKGRYHWSQRTEDGLRKAVQSFREAIIVDPNCAPAYAGIADHFISLGFFGLMPPREAWASAREFALKGLQIDRQLPEAEISLAKCAVFSSLDWREAEQRLLRAIELDPSLSAGHFNYAILLLQTARFESALLELHRARELDPLSLTIGTGVAWAHYYVGHYDKASEECRKVLELQPNYFEAQGCMGLIATAEGRYADAVQWLERAQVAPLVQGFLGYALALQGATAAAKGVLERLKQVAAERYISPIALAVIHVGLGEPEEALNWLENAVSAKEAFVAYAAVFPPFQPLRDTPRFQTLLRACFKGNSLLESGAFRHLTGQSVSATAQTVELAQDEQI
jgi:serine/threonine protein kinase/Tfp pilus assembly protein PilF